jgi:uncharacterized protein (DUF302 family)
MTDTQSSYGFSTVLQMPMEEAIATVTAALKEQGFGVLTTIDVQQTMKQKLDLEVEPYVILGACNPQLAHRALSAERDIGLLLPCNVIVHSAGAGTRVAIVDPQAMLAIASQPELCAVADEARARLQQVLHSLEQSAQR